LSVSRRFESFLQNISLTQIQKDSGAERREKIVHALNQRYWNTNSSTSNSKYVGSWGKYTRIRPPRDVDVLFTLPKSVYDRFQLRIGNRQSQLLQEVRNVLSAKFPSTMIKGDGPVVKVPFRAFNVELIPAFLLTSGQHWICMTDNGGRYKPADYDAEIDSIRDSNSKTKGNVRNLIRMMKRWQAYCDVSIKSFWIELVAVEFLNSWQYKDKSSVYYDWMVRDFLEYLSHKNSSFVYAPGTGEPMYLGNAWISKARQAHKHAQKACNNEISNPAKAGEEWQKIFGNDIPKYT
jgi:hypothetical protein